MDFPWQRKAAPTESLTWEEVYQAFKRRRLQEEALEAEWEAKLHEEYHERHLR